MKWKDHHLIRALIIIFGTAFCLAAGWDEGHRGLIYVWMYLPAAWRTSANVIGTGKQVSFRTLIIGFLIAFLIFTGLTIYFDMFTNPILTLALFAAFATSFSALEYKLGKGVKTDSNISSN